MTKEKEIFEKKLCEEIDQKLSLISALDTVLSEAAFSSCSSKSQSNEDFQENEIIVDSAGSHTLLVRNQANISVRICMDEIVDKIVEFYDSIYNEMPRIGLDKFEDYKSCSGEAFKLTLGSMNIPKVLEKNISRVIFLNVMIIINCF